MSFAGLQHVVAAGHAVLHGAARASSQQGGEAGERSSLRFFAPERAAHPSAGDPDAMQRHVQHLRDQVLHLVRVLSRGVDTELVVVLRDGERDLSFQVEVLLTPDVKPGGHPIAVAVHQIAALPDPRGAHVRLLRVRLGHVEQRWLGIDLYPGASRGLNRRAVRLSRNSEDRLGGVAHLAIREQRVAGKDRADFIGARDVCRGDDIDHPRGGQDVGEVEPGERAASRQAVPRGDVQGVARDRQVVDVLRGPGDVRNRRFVGPAPANDRSRVAHPNPSSWMGSSPSARRSAMCRSSTAISIR